MKAENLRLNNENMQLVEQNKTLTERLNMVENQIKSLKNDIKDEIIRELSVLTPAPDNVSRPVGSNDRDMHSTIFSCLKEQRDIEARKNNLCVHNLPEVDSTSSEIEIFAKFVADNIGVSENETKNAIVSIKRLGKVRETPRLMIVAFNDGNKRKELLKNANKLKDYRTPTEKKVFIMPDMTKNQIVENKKLNDELWNLRRANVSAVIRNGRIIRERNQEQPESATQ